MKKLIASVVAISLLIAGLLWMTRRRPRIPPPETGTVAFKTERSGGGVLFQYQDAQLPLRSLRWMNASWGGIQVAQVTTQSNRQQIAWFDHGVFQAFLMVPKPQGVRDGFFSFAELQDACLWPGDVAVLLYRSPDPATDELPLVLALDLGTQDIRWIHRGKGTRLIRTPDPQEPAVYLFGPKDPIVRLPLATQKTEQASRSGIRSSAKIIELPPEIQEMGDLLPLGAWTFLVAHKGGLSTYLGVKGWTHQVLPDAPPAGFLNAAPKLVRARSLWWQPQPGLLIQLHGDGTIGQTWTPDEMITPDPFAKDGALLHLLGGDAKGRLWFELATPSTPAESSTQEGPEASPATTNPSAEDLPESLSEYASKGIDRLYLWNPEDRVLKRLSWKAAFTAQQPPSGISLTGIPEMHPESEGLLLRASSFAWWLPLDALSFGEPTLTLKPH